MIEGGVGEWYSTLDNMAREAGVLEDHTQAAMNICIWCIMCL